MEQYQERRKSGRGRPENFRLGLLHLEGQTGGTGGLSKESLRLFVDIKNCSDDGVLADLPFELAPGEVVNIALPDKEAVQWENRPVKVVWSNKAEASKIFHTGFQFLQGQSQSGEELLWEIDPEKPLPQDLPFFFQSGFFEAISKMGICLLLNSFKRVRISAGVRFICQGEPGDCLYLIQNGTCVVFIEKEETTRKIARLKKGDVVGEMSVLTGEPRAANVEAQTDMVLWRLGSDVFESLADEHPDLRLLLTEIMSNRFEKSIFFRDRTVGKYLLSNKIGNGGWGIVYSGMHRLLKMPVAIKMMKHDMAMEPVFLETFKREAETIARMRHPNIVSVYDIEEIYKTIFIIMEYLEGVSLREMMEKIGPLPAERCVNILEQICDGLICAHSHEIIHRDIKPGNIFLLENDVVKLLDFGLACPTGTKDMSIAGTVYYAPPEQIEGNSVDFRSDIYSLGILAYEMITGHKPYPEENLAERMDLYCKFDIPDPAEVVHDINPHIRDFIRNCTRCDPDKRYPDTLHAKNELLKFYSDRSKPYSFFEKQERSVTSLLLLHTPEQQQDLKIILEELGNRASEMGIQIHMSEFRYT